jgi:hypothetical protein
MIGSRREKRIDRICYSYNDEREEEEKKKKKLLDE